MQKNGPCCFQNAKGVERYERKSNETFTDGGKDDIIL